MNGGAYATITHHANGFPAARPSSAPPLSSMNPPSAPRTALLRRGLLACALLDYCRLHEILVQAWGPVGGGRLLRALGHEAGPLTVCADLLAALASAKNTTPDAIALAWILRHPAGIQPILGTTRPERVRDAAPADAITLSREEWYALLAAARGQKVP